MGLRSRLSTLRLTLRSHLKIWVVVNIRIPFWVPIRIRHLIFRVPKKDHNFDNYPYSSREVGLRGLHAIRSELKLRHLMRKNLNPEKTSA